MVALATNGRSKMTVEVAVQKDLDFMDTTEHDATDRTQWKVFM